MLISIIVAMDENRGIGIEGKLPWRLSTDLKRFKYLTMGHHLIMGRKTYESIPKNLPGRITIIVTRNREYKSKHNLICYSIDEAIELARVAGEEELFIGGGSSIYSHTIDLADRIYMTYVHTRAKADTFFPEFNHSLWSTKFTTQHEKNSKNEYPHTFKILERLDKE